MVMILIDERIYISECGTWFMYKAAVNIKAPEETLGFVGVAFGAINQSKFRYFFVHGGTKMKSYDGTHILTLNN